MPERALAEMIRVCRPSGKVVVFDFDWDTLLVDHADRSSTRKVLDLMADSLRTGRIGRRLPGMVEGAGLGEFCTTTADCCNTPAVVCNNAVGIEFPTCVLAP